MSMSPSVPLPVPKALAAVATRALPEPATACRPGRACAQHRMEYRTRPDDLSIGANPAQARGGIGLRRAGIASSAGHASTNCCWQATPGADARSATASGCGSSQPVPRADGRDRCALGNPDASTTGVCRSDLLASAPEPAWVAASGAYAGGVRMSRSTTSTRMAMLGMTCL